MSVQSSLAAAQVSVAAVIERYAALLDSESALMATNGPRPSYGLDGENFDWPGFFKHCNEQIQENTKLLQLLDAPGEVRSRGIT